MRGACACRSANPLGGTQRSLGPWGAAGAGLLARRRDPRRACGRVRASERAPLRSLSSASAGPGRGSWRTVALLGNHCTMLLKVIGYSGHARRIRRYRGQSDRLHCVVATDRSRT